MNAREVNNNKLMKPYGAVVDIVKVVTAPCAGGDIIIRIPLELLEEV